MSDATAAENVPATGAANVSAPGGAPEADTGDCESCRRFFEIVGERARLHAVKLYRLSVALPEPVPVLPCLDHEAMLHEGIPPHAAAYIEDLDGGGLHEIVCVPARRRIEVDIVSTDGEHTTASHARLVGFLRERFPGQTIQINGPSWLRGDTRVTRACRAQISLREVLMDDDMVRLTAALDRLKTIGGLMEKQSRVASWSVRTITGPLLAFAGFVTFQGLGALTGEIGAAWVQWLQVGTVGALGAVFLYLGLKAVHLTEVASRIWKRGSEYGLILAERRRLEAARPRPVVTTLAGSGGRG